MPTRRRVVAREKAITNLLVLMDNRLFTWMRHSSKDEMCISKGIVAFLAIAAIVVACVYLAA